MTNKTIPATTKPAAGPQGSPAPLRGVRPRPNGESIRSGDLVLGAARMEAEEASRRGDPLNSASRKYAAELRDRVATAPECMTEIGLAANSFRRAFSARTAGRALQFADTVKNPNYVTVDASPRLPRPRYEAAALESDLDASKSIDAKNN